MLRTTKISNQSILDPRQIKINVLRENLTITHNGGPNPTNLHQEILVDLYMIISDALNADKVILLKIVILKCGKPGHIFSECGQQKSHFNLVVTKTRPTTTGRVYTMTRAEAAENHDLFKVCVLLKEKV